MSLEKIFATIYREKVWVPREGSETVSGWSAELAHTNEIRETLPRIVSMLGIGSMLDAGCGDWNWMRHLRFPGVKIYACDIVPDLVEHNKLLMGSLAEFILADIVEGTLPAADLVLCRSTLYHLSNANVLRAIRNMTKSANKYLMMTSHSNAIVNEDIKDGGWRRLNLLEPPFSLPTPTGAFFDGPGQDGSLCWWPIDDMRKWVEKNSGNG